MTLGYCVPNSMILIISNGEGCIFSSIKSDKLVSLMKTLILCSVLFGLEWANICSDWMMRKVEEIKNCI